MSLRISSLIPVLVLAGCGVESGAPPGIDIECAIGTGAEFASVCTLEQVEGDGGIVLHHPDGGFRRVASDPASGALVAVDGVDPLVPEPGGEGLVAFAIGADRYRLPSALLAPSRQ